MTVCSVVSSRDTQHYTRKKFRKEIMQEEEKAAVRALKTSAWVAVFTTLLLIRAAHTDWAWGFSIGAFVSLFSLVSLTIVIPMLFQPGASSHVRGLLGLTLFMKLPVYAGCLYLATSVRGVAPMAVGIGLALSPIVITARTIGIWLTAPIRARILSARRNRETEAARCARPIPAEPARERG